MKPMLQSVIATGALALLLALPAAPLLAGPGGPGRTGPADPAWSHSGPEAILVHDRWDRRHSRWHPRQDRWRGRHVYPPHWRHRHRHRHGHWYGHRPYPHRAAPHWGFTYPFACVAAKPWPRGHWRNHRHRHGRGHRHRVPRHRHVHCRGGFTVVLPLPHPPHYYR